MQSSKVLAIILAGGSGSRMDVLTEVRAKPALPFAGVYRLIDFPLSNCVHSSISDVWVVEQFQPHSLNEHLLNGRPWDLDRTYGGLRIMPPYQGTRESGWHRGNADALYRNSRFIREFAPDVLLVLSSDHVYKIDYRQVIAAHLERGADVTLVTTTVPREEATRFGNVQVGADAKVVDFAYKPSTPIRDTVTTEIFVYTATTLLAILDELAADQGNAGEEHGLKDFGDELLPQLVQRGRAYAYPLDGYWRDVGTLSSYWQSHMDLLGEPSALQLDSPEWPLRSTDARRQAARIYRTAAIDNSLIAPGCDIRGEVVRSIVGPGVRVAEGARIEDSIVFRDVVVGADVVVARAIVDSEVRIGRGADAGKADVAVSQAITDQQLVVIGKGAQVPAGAWIHPGQRIQPFAAAREIRSGDAVSGEIDASNLL